MTVSYTHLDVYKRQGLGFLDRQNSCFIGVIQRSFVFVGGLKFIPTIVAVICFLWLDSGKSPKSNIQNPVSYTHLDVYKRQIHFPII